MAKEVKEVKYVGLSLAEARKALAEDAKKGSTRADGAALKPEAKEALAQISQALASPAMQAEHYVVCWSEGCVIKGDW